MNYYLLLYGSLQLYGNLKRDSLHIADILYL